MTTPASTPTRRSTAQSGARPVGTRRFERYLVVIAGVFGLLFTVQRSDALIAGWPSMADPVGVVSIVLMFASALVGMAAVLTPQHGRSFLFAAFVIYLLAVTVWPFAIHADIPSSPMPWFLGLWPVPFGYLVIASTRTIAVTVTTLSVAVYEGLVLGVVGHVDLSDVIATVLFMIAISGVFGILVHAIRRAVVRAQAAQQAALSEYERTTVDDASETERIRTDALLHDSVLTTFLAASAAGTPDAEDLARRMAENALRVLAHVNRAAELGPAVPFGKAFAATDTIAAVLPAFALRSEADDLVLPASAAEALLTAMVQAMTNSVQHAGTTTRRTLTITELGPDGVRIVVADDGVGFDATRLPSGRPGLRASIIDRLRQVDGRADIDSAPGRGTTVTLSWGSVVISGTAPLAEHRMVASA